MHAMHIGKALMEICYTISKRVVLLWQRRRPLKKARALSEQTVLRIKDPITGQVISSDVVVDGFFASSLSPNDTYANGSYEIECSRDMVILTSVYRDYTGSPASKDRIQVGRTVLSGNFNSDSSGNLTGTVSRLTAYKVTSDVANHQFGEAAQSYTVQPNTRISSALRFSPDSLSAVIASSQPCLFLMIGVA